MTLAAEEFIRSFLLHVLPKGLVRIRHYGWMAAVGESGRHPAGRCSRLSPPIRSRRQPTTRTRKAVSRVPEAIEVVEMIVPRELSRGRHSHKLRWPPRCEP